MKYFVFSDVHSFYDELMSALNEKGFDIDNSEHVVISCGDLFDRGPKSKECLDFIVNMIKQGRALCVKGNHEEMLIDVFIRQHLREHDFHNGTAKTFDQLCSIDSPDLTWLDIITNVKKNKDLKLYMTSCADYHEIGDNIFVHGWIPSKHDWKDGDWSRARWVNGMEKWSQGVKLKNKTIYCGHWHASWGHANLHNDGIEFLERIHTSWIDPITGKQEPHANYSSFKDDGICCLDACTVLSHKVNVETIEI